MKQYEWVGRQENDIKEGQIKCISRSTAQLLVAKSEEMRRVVYERRKDGETYHDGDPNLSDQADASR